MKKKFFLFALAALIMAACEPNVPFSGGGGGGGKTNDTGIPSDDDADPNPTINDTTVTLPGITTTIDTDGGDIIIRLDMTGVIDPSTGEYLKLYGTNHPKQNVWVEVDNVPKGIEVKNLSDSLGSKVKADLIFLVDNSGSMEEEADTIANGIEAWSKLLVSSGIDIQFGVVGYEGQITGGLDITTAAELADFLDYGYGINRTYHFGGAYADYLEAQAPSYYNSGWMDECGMAAFHFANENFHFRNGANRIYVNFTDEPNYYLGIDKFRTSWLQDHWVPTMGTIHSVYSDGIYAEENTYESEGSHDFPWRMAEYTGGTKLFANYDFSGVQLSSLPVTGAMQNSYIIRFTNVTLDNKMHKVKVTIKNQSGSVAGELIFNILFANPNA